MPLVPSKFPQIKVFESHIDENLKGAIRECTPLCEIFTKMRVCQAVSNQNTPEKRERGNLHLAVKVMTFFLLAVPPWAHQGVIWKSE